MRLPYPCVNHVAAVKQPVRCKLQIFLHFKIQRCPKHYDCSDLDLGTCVRFSGILHAFKSGFLSDFTIRRRIFTPVCRFFESTDTREYPFFRISSRLNIPDSSAFEIRKRVVVNGVSLFRVNRHPGNPDFS